MSKAPGAPKVANLNDLLAVAYQIEIDAVDRYKLLADQMETHNNPELVKIFRDLARAEGIHGEEIRRWPAISTSSRTPARSRNSSEARARKRPTSAPRTT